MTNFTSVGKKYSMWRSPQIKGTSTSLCCLLLILLLGLLPSEMLSQDFPEQCVSQDLLVVDAELVFDDPCLNCEEGEILYPTLSLGIENKTGSFRPTFAFWGTLIVSDAEGNEIGRKSITGCNNEEGLPANTTTYIPFDQVEYICGSGLKIIDLHLAWTDASQSGKNECPLDPTSINPKCGTLTEIEVRPPLFVSVLDKNDVVCKGDGNGTIDLYVNGGDQPYTFDWADLGGTNDPQDRTGLAPGRYSVTVTDANGCFRQISDIEITEPEEEVVVSAAGENITCYGYDDGSIAVTASGYDRLELWTDSSEVTGASLSGNVYSDLSPGIYVVKAFADGGNGEVDACSAESDPIEITQPDALTLSLEAGEILCYGGTTSINLSVTGGTAPYNYDWSDLPGEDDPEDRTATGAGLYVVTVTDAKDCTATVSIEVMQPEELDAIVTPAHVTCYGASDGSITISAPQGGSGDYLFSIDGSTWQAELVFTGLIADTYDVWIRDAEATDCVIRLEDDLEIEQPKVLFADVDHLNVTCHGGSDGSITLSNASGGSGHYQFSINGTDWQPELNFAGLSAGTYEVYIRDAKAVDCVVTLEEDLVIGQPDVLAATVTSEDITCYGGSGSITIENASGGSGEFEYSLDGTEWQLSPVFDELAEGFYEVYIRDASATHCIVQLKDDLEIEQPAILSADVDSSDVTCYGGSDGSITISSPQGGSGDYLFSINGTTWQTELVFTGLAADSYDVWIRDANAADCAIRLEDNLEIKHPEELSAVVTPANVSCYGGSDGSITISFPEGGSGDYQFSIDGTSWQTELVFSGLTADTYDVWVRDANATDCVIQLEEDLKIEQPAILFADVDHSDVTCYGGSDGTINITNPTGGSGTYEVSINGTTWQSALIFADLSAGTYDVYIRDAEAVDCIITLEEDLVINQPDILAAVVTSEDITCYQGSGSISIENPTGGSGAYEYRLGGTDWQVSPVFDKLAAGFYDVYIRDANAQDCEILLIEDLELEQPVMLSADVNLSDVTCFGGSDGSITISNASGGSGHYEFTIDGVNWKSTVVFADLTAGTYDVWIRDTNATDCAIQLENDLVIGQPDELVAVVTPAHLTCYGGSDGSITISSPEGGSGVYQFSIDGSTWQTELVFTGLIAHNYDVWIRDANATDCIIQLEDDLEIEQPAVLFADVAYSDVICYDGSDGMISISNPAGGSGSYQFSINGTSWQSALIFAGLSAGTYDVYIRDAEAVDCVVTLEEDLVINQPDVLAATVISEEITCYGGSGIITIENASGGSGQYEYSLGGTEWQLSPVFDELAEGFYDVYIRDASATACIVQLVDDLEIEQPVILSADVDSSDVTCYGGSDGVISISNASGGSGTYEFSIDGSTWLSGLVFADLAAGTYDVWIRDANVRDCAILIENDLEIAEPPFLNVQVSVDDVSCNGLSDGRITLTVSGGTAPYTSEWGDADEEGIIILEGLGAGEYNVAVFDANGCGLAVDGIPVNQPDDVITPVLEAVQPTCEILTGSILVTSATSDLLFSLNGGEFTAYPAGGYANLDPGIYTLQARNSNECLSGVATITLYEATDCEEFTGCTLGYWKNHTDRWCGEYQTCMAYGEVFEGAPAALADLTLLEVLNLGGGGIYNLGRQSVAALLNACSEEVDYELETTADVIAYVNENFGNAHSAGAYLDMLNNAGCTMGGSRATTAPSEGCDDEANSGNGNNGNNGNNGKGNKNQTGVTASFDAYPVPFGQTLNLRYNFDYSSDVRIEIYDMNNRHLKTFKDKKVSRGSETVIQTEFAPRGNQMYIVKVITDREEFVKQIISSKK